MSQTEMRGAGSILALSVPPCRAAIKDKPFGWALKSAHP
jgi:hypothetical protein